jgi:uncharacterized delta-60 repeat protein
VGTPRNKDLDSQVMRFTPTGQLDPTFKTSVFDIIGEGGSANRDFLNAVALQADGRVVLVGSHTHAFANAVNALVRLNPNGSFDTTFGTNGIVTNKIPAGTVGLNLVLIQSDGKILTLGAKAGKSKGSPCGDPLKFWVRLALEGGFDFETPGFQERLGDVFRIFVAACPLAQAGGAQILVGGELVLAHDLLKFGDGGDDRPDRLGLAPVGISATLRHETCLSYKGG